MTGYDSKRDAAADKQHWNEDEWRRNNWRCGHGWLRGEQCEICNAPQPAQEPIAWMYQCTADNSGPVLLRHRTNWAESNSGLWTETPLYTAPPQRKWVGLTDTDFCREINTDDFLAGAFFADAKLKEKNT